MSQEKIQVSDPGARLKFEGWVANRGGVIVWESADFQDRPFIFTPAKKENSDEQYEKPYWAYRVREVVTDISRFDFVDLAEVKRFHIAVRLGSNGLMLKLTDASTRKVRNAVEKATEKYGRKALYGFDYDTQEAVIWIPVQEGETLESILKDARQRKEKGSGRRSVS